MKAIEVIHEMGVYSKLEEVQTSSSESVRVVRSKVGLTKAHYSNTFEKAKISGFSSEINIESQASVEEKYRKGPGIATVYVSSRSRPQKQTKRSQSSLAYKGEYSNERSKGKTSKGHKGYSETVVNTRGIQQIGPISASACNNDSPHRCVPDGMQTWSPALRSLHINCLQLLAVIMSLKKLRPPQGSHIQLVIDNMTAVCVLR